MTRLAAPFAAWLLALTGAPAQDASAPAATQAPGTVWVVGDAFEFPAAPASFAAPCFEVEVRGAPAASEPGRDDEAAVASDARGPCAGTDHRVLLRRGVPADAIDSYELERDAHSARTFYLHGSPSVVDWYECLAPSGESRLLRGLRRAHAGGATLVGRGRAGALLGAWVAAEFDELERIERNPRRAEQTRLVAGLAVFDWGLLEAGEGASLARAVNQCVEERLRWAAFVEPGAGLEIDLASERASAHGEGAVWILDLRRARRMRSGLRGVLLTVLGAGDAWDRSGRAAPTTDAPDAARRGEISPRSGRAARAERAVDDALEAARWREALRALRGGSAAQTLLSRDGSAVVTFRVDARTQLVEASRATEVLVDVQRFELPR